MKESRSIDRLKIDYEFERFLANQLKTSSKEERRILYSKLYEKFYASIPDHPIVFGPRDVSWQIKFLRRFVNSNHRYLELGAGDCLVCWGIAEFVKLAVAIDCNKVLIDKKQPENAELIISDSTDICLASESIDIIFSSEHLEHLHPDDAKNQIKEIYRVLKRSGIFICFTPNRLLGPHDVSKHFNDVSNGFHLKEYSYQDLQVMFENVGFHAIFALIGYHQIQLDIPLNLITSLERLFHYFPKVFRRSRIFYPILGAKIRCIK